MKKQNNNIVENVSVQLEDVKEETREDKRRIHVVGKNESLWHVSLVELGAGHRYREIMELNGMIEKWVHEGQILTIPDK